MCVCVSALMYGCLPVSQWCNDKPFSAAQEFILVDKANICDVDDHLVGVFIEVEAALLQPLKVVGAFDMQSALRGIRVRTTERRGMKYGEEERRETGGEREENTDKRRDRRRREKMAN